MAAKSTLEREQVLPLPGSPPPSIVALWACLTDEQRTALRPHLLGTTSAEWLAFELTEAGHPIGPTSIKKYRRALRQAGV